MPLAQDDPSVPSPPAPALSDARHPDLARFVLEHAVRRGRFELASGAVSDYYCDAKQVSFAPEGAFLTAEAILAELEDETFDAVGGMDMGATPIVAALALRSHERRRPFPTFVVRKQVKGHGTRRRIEGIIPPAPARVVIVDDVITTAGSIVDAIEVVREAGHEVVLAVCILDRESGGAERLASLGVPFRPLVTVSELGLGAAATHPSRSSRHTP